MPRTTELGNAISNTGLCQKRDQIVELFEKLLARLIDEAVNPASRIPKPEYRDLNPESRIPEPESRVPNP